MCNDTAKDFIHLEGTLLPVPSCFAGGMAGCSSMARMHTHTHTKYDTRIPKCDAHIALCPAVFAQTKQLLAPCRMVRDNETLIGRLLHSKGMTVSPIR